MHFLIYILTVFFATMCGSSAGVGGGVVIKPMFDLLTHDPTFLINFYSSSAIFTMAVISVIKQHRNGFQFKFKMLSIIGLGSIIGGFIGQKILRFSAIYMIPKDLRILQSICLTIFLAVVLTYSLIKNKLPHFKVENLLVTFIIGLLLGTMSVFLGIGGGSLNVAIMMILFSYDMKSAAVYSVGIIVFSQGTKLLMTAFNVVKGSALLHIDPVVFILVIVSAILGAFTGTFLNKRLSNKYLSLIYNSVLIVLIFVTLHNTLVLL